MSEYRIPNIEEYIETYIRDRYLEYVASMPWWCPMCGEGGNYEGPRPAMYNWPPEEHICVVKVTEQELQGIRTFRAYLDEMEFIPYDYIAANGKVYITKPSVIDNREPAEDIIKDNTALIRDRINVYVHYVEGFL